MISPLSDQRIREARLAPAATIAVPIEWFEPFGVELHRDEDDLDRYRFACLENNAGLTFGLLHYDQAPAGETTSLLPDSIADEAALRPTILAFAREFDLPLQSFHGTSDGGNAARPPAA